jgi:Flp pilus assembly protein TadG
MKHNKRSQKNRIRQGTAAVEFAMVMPVFVLVIVGAMELFNLNMCKSIVINKTREAARLAINTNAESAQITATTISQVADILKITTSDIACNITATAPDGTPRPSFSAAKKGDLVTVTVSLPYSKIAVFASGFMNNTLQLSDRCIMQKE